MLNETDLDGLKLVRGENIANKRDVLRAVEEAVMQGSQGWGVVDEQSVLLAVLLELRSALTTVASAAGVADECVVAENALKGKQMELGRMQARLNRKEGELQRGTSERSAAEGQMHRTQKSLADVTKRHGELLVIGQALSDTVAEITRERDDMAQELDAAVTSANTFMDSQVVYQRRIDDLQASVGERADMGIVIKAQSDTIDKLMLEARASTERLDDLQAALDMAGERSIALT